jgi:hypothetical protein
MKFFSLKLFKYGILFYFSTNFPNYGVHMMIFQSCGLVVFKHCTHIAGFLISCFHPLLYLHATLLTNLQLSIMYQIGHATITFHDYVWTVHIYYKLDLCTT